MKSSMLSGTGQLCRWLAADVAALGWPASRPAPRVTDADLAALPGAAVRYLNFMRVVGQPPDSSFLAHFAGRFRLRPQLPWMRCEAWQYDSSPTVARLFHMRITAAGVLPMTGRDAYVHGRGRMRGKLAGLVTVADSSGPENDASELVTYLWASSSGPSAGPSLHDPYPPAGRRPRRRKMTQKTSMAAMPSAPMSRVSPSTSRGTSRA